MDRTTPSHRTLAAFLALFAALPSVAQAQAAPPPPEQLPWAQPAPQAEPQQGLLPRKETPAQPAQAPAAPQQQQYAAPPPQQQQYAPPPQQQYAAPAPQQQQYAPPPQQQQYAPPPQQQYAAPAPQQQQYAAPPQQQQYAAPPQQQQQYAAPPQQQQPQAYPPPQPYPQQQPQPQVYATPPQQPQVYATPPQQPQAYPPAPGYAAPLQAYPLASPPPAQARPPQQTYRPDYAYDPRTGTWYLLAPPPPAPPQAYAPPASPPPAAPPPAPVAPQPRPFEPEVEFAIRTGVISPGGDAVPGVAMDRLFGKAFALGLELGVRATPHLHLGLLAEGAGGMPGSDFAGPSGCGSMASCDGNSVSGRVGLQLRYHLLPYHGVDPWIAYGVALSGAAVESPGPSGTTRRTLAGYEYAKLSAGLDFKLGRGSAFGLFAEWTAGRYTQYEDKVNGVLVSSGTVSPTTTHSWFTIGPRIRF